jgi:hypothetical protein
MLRPSVLNPLPYCPAHALTVSRGAHPYLLAWPPRNSSPATSSSLLPTLSSTRVLSPGPQELWRPPPKRCTGRHWQWPCLSTTPVRVPTTSRASEVGRPPLQPTTRGTTRPVVVAVGDTVLVLALMLLVLLLQLQLLRRRQEWRRVSQTPAGTLISPARARRSGGTQTAGRLGRTAAARATATGAQPRRLDAGGNHHPIRLMRRQTAPACTLKAAATKAAA